MTRHIFIFDTDSTMHPRYRTALNDLSLRTGEYYEVATISSLAHVPFPVVHLVDFVIGTFRIDAQVYHTLPYLCRLADARSILMLLDRRVSPVCGESLMALGCMVTDLHQDLPALRAAIATLLATRPATLSMHDSRWEPYNAKEVMA